MAYVTKGNRDDAECPFCTRPVDAAKLPGLIVHAGHQAYVTLNLYPYNNGHLLILPYRHVADLNELEPDEANELVALLIESRAVLQRELTPDGYNIGMNLGTAAGAGIPQHVHFHIVPRWDGDTNFMPVTGDVKVLPETLLQTHDRLVTAWETEHQSGSTPP